MQYNTIQFDCVVRLTRGFWLTFSLYYARFLEDGELPAAPVNLTTNEGGVAYSCAICAKRYVLESDLASHVRLRHSRVAIELP